MKRRNQRPFSKKVTSYKDYRIYLRDRMAEIRTESDAHSLSAVAKKVGIHKSTLSRVLSGKRELDPPMVPLLLETLGVPPDEQDYFYVLYLKRLCGAGQANKVIDAMLGQMLYSKRVFSKTVDKETRPSFRSKDKQTLMSRLGALIVTISELEGFMPQPLWIQKCLSDPSFSLEEIASTLDRAKKQKLLKNLTPAEFKAQPKDYFKTTEGLDVGGHFSFLGPLLEAMQRLMGSPAQHFPAGAFSLFLSFDSRDKDKVLLAMEELRTKLIAISKAAQVRDWLVASGFFFSTEAGGPGNSRMKHGSATNT